MSPRNSLLGYVFCVAACTLSCFGGCNKNPLGRLEVSGRVTFDGQPLDKGTIEFQPRSAARP